MHAGWRLAGRDFGSPRFLFLQLFLFIGLAGNAFAAHLQQRRGGQRNPRAGMRITVGDAVRLMLHRIIDGADFEFRLNGSGETRNRKLGR
jgi:hypothetical protein